MCGIFGYVGKRNAVDLALEGLKKLEYRGYDSAGIAGVIGGELVSCKEVGKVAVLEETARGEKLALDVAIAHTRWATHGMPSHYNAHPHFDVASTLALVHNGIIENYQALRTELRSSGVPFVSETDSEVVAQLVGTHYKGDLLQAVQATLPQLKGAFAIALVHKAHPDQIVVAAHDSPLAIGVGNGETFVASDVNAFLKYVRNVIYLEEGECARITAGVIEVFGSNGKKLNKPTIALEGSAEEISKAGFAHFTLKEICEQPSTMRQALLGRIDLTEGRPVLDELSIGEQNLREVDRILILACGTSFHAGLVASYMIEEIARIPCEVQISSEFRYKNPIVQPRTLVLPISQSGETADTLAAVRECRAKGARVISLCNVQGSSLARISDSTLLLRAGPEIGVCSTKAYTNQLAVLALFTLYMARLRDYPKAEGRRFLEDLLAVPEAIQEVLGQREHIQKLAKKYAKYENFFFIGRNYMYPTALECALKLKEISYINANAYPAGELKHGPIALVEPNCPTVALCANAATFDKMHSNLMEVRARRGKVIAIATSGSPHLSDVSDDQILIPPVPDPFATITSSVAGQLLAYYIALDRGAEIDQPRNLAKSVTVE